MQNFSSLLVRWNKGMNLISRRDINRLLPRHLLDSLSVLPHIIGSSVLDVGTGPGLPGMPLAIVDPNRTYTLCDRMAKRIRFLHMASRELETSNVSLEERNLAKDPFIEKRFDTILARGVAPADALWPMVEPYLELGGRVIVFESAQVEALEDTSESGVPEQDSLDEIALGYSSEKISCLIPGLEQPHFLCILQRKDKD
ncbi:MAG: 16S rRNA (guanine(527)-N(7))-methyltransferase RsmG [Pseudomonadales bacterium]|nr:16S rRNA (guanine(527)-N(7))-methyltransferase RsmG [Pseudomonadales bacterium]